MIGQRGASHTRQTPPLAACILFVVMAMHAMLVSSGRPPEFVDSFTVLQPKESEEVGRLIGSLEAFDQEGGPMSFSIKREGSHFNLFTVNNNRDRPNFCDVFNTRALDFEGGLIVVFV